MPSIVFTEDYLSHSVHQKSLPIYTVGLIVEALSVLNKDQPSIILLTFFINWPSGFLWEHLHMKHLWYLVRWWCLFVYVYLWSNSYRCNQRVLVLEKKQILHQDWKRQINCIKHNIMNHYFASLYPQNVMGNYTRFKYIQHLTLTSSWSRLQNNSSGHLVEVHVIWLRNMAPGSNSDHLVEAPITWFKLGSLGWNSYHLIEVHATWLKFMCSSCHMFEAHVTW